MYFFAYGSDDYFLFHCPYDSTLGSLGYPLGYLVVKKTKKGTRYVITDNQKGDLFSNPILPNQHLQKGESDNTERAYVLDFVKTGYLAIGDQYRILHNVELDSEDPPDVWLVLENAYGCILTTIPNEAATDSLSEFKPFDKVRFNKRFGIPYLVLAT